MIFTPPAPLDTPEAVADFARQYPDINARRWIAFARKTPLVQPSLLPLLPKSVPWELTTVREELRFQKNTANLTMPADIALESIDQLRGRLLTAAEGLPEDFLEAAALIVAEGRQAFLRASKRSARRIPALGFPNVTFSDALQLSEFLGHAFYAYLNRRDHALATHLEKTFCMLMHFGPDQRRNYELLTALTTLPAGSFQLFTQIEDVVSDVLIKRRTLVFQPLLQEFLMATKDHLRVLTDPGAGARTLSVFKQRIFHAINATATSCDDVAVRLPHARRDLEKILAWAEGRLGAETLVKTHSRIDNFLEKLDQFDRFFTKRFCLRELAVVRDALNRLHGRDGNRWQVVSTTTLTVTKVAWLQPAKDYLEYRKGMISGDCTSDGMLAAMHLRHPRFFNVRIFVGPSVLDWRGNIYCLFYNTDDERSVIIDRVQIDRSKDLVPLDFFPSLLVALCDRLFKGQDLKVLAPRQISNYQRLQTSYERYLQETKPPLVPFVFGPADQPFECSREKQLYRLR